MILETLPMAAPITADNTVSFGLIVQGIASVATLGGVGFAIFKLGRNTQKVENGINQAIMAAEAQKVEMTDLKSEVRELGKVLTQMAVTTTRLDAISESVTRLNKWVDELRHGEGFVYPLDSRLNNRLK